MLIKPHYQIRSNSIIEYAQDVEKRHFKLRTEAQKENGLENKYRIWGLHLRNYKTTYTGTVTMGMKKRLEKACQMLLLCSKEKKFWNEGIKKHTKFRINFITLTFAENDHVINSKEAHALVLEPFLKHLRQAHGVINYVWKAEYQAKRELKQLHYHIMTDVYIPWKDIRKKFNQLQQRAGYLEGHFNKFGHYNPNSTDVHAFRKTSDIAGYIKKEVLKSYQNSIPMDGKVWDACLSLKSSKYFTIPDIFGLFTMRLYLDQRRQTKKFFVKEKIEKERCTIYNFFPNKSPIDFLSDNELKDFNDTINNILNFERKPPLKELLPQKLYNPPPEQQKRFKSPILTLF